jgi:hypothetical protein
MDSENAGGTMAAPTVKTKRTPTNISRNNKQRGRSMQQEIRDAILTKFPTLQLDDCRSTSSGAQGEDVQLSPAARKLLPIQIECKRIKSAIGIYKWYGQAKAHGPHEPVVFLRADRQPPLVILSADAYLDLLRRVSDGKS